MRFQSERDLIAQVIGPGTTSIWEALGYEDWNAWGALELEGFFGIPDLVLAFGRHDSIGRPLLRTIAFEFKLSNWRKALAQAYRYRSFAQCSYVVIDDAFVNRALGGLDKFIAANIGLISVSYLDEITVHHKPRVITPYTPKLRDKFTELASSFLFNEPPTDACLGKTWDEEVAHANFSLNQNLKYCLARS